MAKVLEPLVRAGLTANHHIKPSGEPTIDDVNDIVLALRRHQCNLIISLGGGSVIDAAKAAAGVATNGGDLRGYLEGVGSGKVVARLALPHIAIPTTAGTGAEVTRNAVISSKEGQFKKSIRSPYLCPLATVLDAELTCIPAERSNRLQRLGCHYSTHRSVYILQGKSTPVIL